MNCLNIFGIVEIVCTIFEIWGNFPPDFRIPCIFTPKDAFRTGGGTFKGGEHLKNYSE